MKFNSIKIAVLLFVATFHVHAQNTLDNLGLTSSTPSSVAYSLRLLSSSYTGPLVRIRIGSSFYDVYPDASAKNFSLTSKISTVQSVYNSAVAVASSNTLNSIVTSGTTDARVAIWYDQSGNSKDVLTSLATGPKIITLGSINIMNGKPTIYFASVVSSTAPLVSATTVDFSTQQTATVNAVAQNVGSVSNISGVYSTGLSGGWGLSYDPTTGAPGYWLDGSGCNQAFTGATSFTPKIVTGFLNKTTSSSTVYENSILKGTKTITCGITNGTSDNVCVGIRAANGGTRKFDGYISEVILFPSILSTANQSTLETNQNTAYFSPSVTISSNSTNNSVCSGTSVTFTATLYNYTSIPAYQWYKNSVAISGATSATYSTAALSNNDVISVSCTNASNIVNDASLSLWLDAANTSSYSGTGSTWTNLGTGGVTYNASINAHQTFSLNDGGHFLFDGTANPMLINKVTSATSEVTMSAWVFITPGTTSGSFIKNGANLGYTFGAGGGGGFCNSNFPGMLLAGQSWLGSNPGSSNFLTGWQLCTMVITGSSPTTYKYYINGTLANTATFTGASAPSGSYTAIGDNYGDGGACTPFNSKMAAAYIYSKALTVAEIKQNYNALAPRFGLNSTNSIASNSITITVNPSPIVNVTVNGDACINKTTLSATTGLTSYAWYKDNVLLSGAITNAYLPSASGDYKVLVSNGTCTNTSLSSTIYFCGVTADGKMVPVDNSTTLISKEGAINNGNGIDERGLIVEKPFVYGTVTSSTGRIWMDRNLGATQVATSVTDATAYGDLYEWGRGKDGHQLRTSTATSTQSASDSPGNNLFIYGSGDWLNPSNDNLWQGVTGINNPCPTGFRFPTKGEWETEIVSWSSQSKEGGFASPLKLPTPGFRNYSNGAVTNEGLNGDYWSSTVDGANSFIMYIHVGAGTVAFPRAYGFSCRCIKD